MLSLSRATRLDEVKILGVIYEITSQTKQNTIYVLPCIIDTNNIDNQLDATITVY